MANYASLQVQQGGNETDCIAKGTDIFSHFDTDELTTPPPGATIYTAAIVTTLGVSTSDNSFASFLVVLPAWLVIVLNAAASLVIIEFIHEIRDETPICEANLNLLLLGVVIFNVYNVGEIFETLDIAAWIYNFKTVDSHQPLTFADADDAGRQIVSGMTAWFKSICYLVIVLPKLIVGVLLAFYGSGFLLVSDDNESLILNTVALTFITQIDDLIYESMVPSNIKQCIDDLPASPISYAQKMAGLARPYLVAILLAVITYASCIDSCGGLSLYSQFPTSSPVKSPRAGKYPSA